MGESGGDQPAGAAFGHYQFAPGRRILLDDAPGEILDLGVKAGIVEKSGSWFSYDSIRIGQGRENAKTYLKEHSDVCDRLEAAIRGKTDEVAEEMMTGPDAED